MRKALPFTSSLIRERRGSNSENRFLGFTLFCEPPNVCHHSLDIFRAHALTVGGHFVLALFDDGGQLVVATIRIVQFMYMIVCSLS